MICLIAEGFNRQNPIKCLNAQVEADQYSNACSLLLTKKSIQKTGLLLCVRAQQWLLDRFKF